MKSTSQRRPSGSERPRCTCPSMSKRPVKSCPYHGRTAPMYPADQQAIVFAERRWGHGRVRQLLRRFLCADSHDWAPAHWEDGLGIARCRNECGAQLWQREEIR